MKSFFHSLIPFLPSFCSCQFQRLDWIQFLHSQSQILAGWHLETLLFISGLHYCSLLGYAFWLCPFITPQYVPHRKHRLYCWRGMLTMPFPSNTRPIVTWGNGFTESLPTTGYTCHNMLNIFCLTIFVFTYTLNFVFTYKLLYCCRFLPLWNITLMNFYHSVQE
jgi:hypothetical protein